MIAAMSPGANAKNPVAFDTGSDNQSGLTFSPDGSIAFWVAWNGRWGSRTASRRVIYTAQQQDGEWSTPAPAKFSGDHSDSDPFVSPDGHWLYFVSERPTDADDLQNDRNIWRYSLLEENRLEYLSINSDAAEYSPVVTASGALYFASNRGGDPGNGDLYRAAPTDEEFLPPQPLGPAFNTPTGEWNIWVSPDENEIIFEASSRPTNVSIPGDLYYSWRTPAGWTAAIPVEQLNTPDSDLMPRMSPDGETLYYTSAPIGGHAEIATTEWAPLRAALRSSYAPSLIVANRSSHEVTFVDLSRGDVVARVATGEGPHLLSNVSDGRVLTTGFGEFPRPHAAPVSKRPPFVVAPNSRLTLIDVVDRVAVLDARIEDCARPHASWIVANRGYVTCEKEKRVHVIDLDSARTIDHIETLQEGSHVLSFEAGSRTLVTSNVDPGSITLINIDSGDTKVVKLAAGSEGSLAVGGRVWIANAIAGSVAVVDPHAGEVIRQVDSVCGFPIALSPDTHEQVWVACFASAELVAIDRNDFAITRRIKLADQPLNLLTHPKLDLAYVSLPRQNAIAEIDLASGQELRRLSVGIEPDGLRWAQADSQSRDVEARLARAETR
jgi:Tol biopolymer transport system component